MIISLEISSNQLEALHKALNEHTNSFKYFWENDSYGVHSSCLIERSFVMIQSLKSLERTLRSPRERPDDEVPVPDYEVVLRVNEHIKKTAKDKDLICTPMDRLMRVLHAIGLFPVEVEEEKPVPPLENS